MTVTLPPPPAAEPAPASEPARRPEFVPGAPPPAPVLADVWRGITRENPVLVQFLGMCPTMAVTNGRWYATSVSGTPSARRRMTTA